MRHPIRLELTRVGLLVEFFVKVYMEATVVLDFSSSSLSLSQIVSTCLYLRKLFFDI